MRPSRERPANGRRRVFVLARVARIGTEGNPDRTDEARADDPRRSAGWEALVPGAPRSGRGGPRDQDLNVGLEDRVRRPDVDAARRGTRTATVIRSLRRSAQRRLHGRSRGPRRGMPTRSRAASVARRSASAAGGAAAADAQEPDRDRERRDDARGGPYGGRGAQRGGAKRPRGRRSARRTVRATRQVEESHRAAARRRRSGKGDTCDREVVTIRCGLPARRPPR